MSETGVSAAEHYGSPGSGSEVTHACPVPFAEGGDGTMPCCGLTPFEVPRYHRITLDPALVTCGKPAAARTG